jgi:hypothetical protein
LNCRNGICIPKGWVTRNDRSEDDNLKSIGHKFPSCDVQKKSDASAQWVVPPITMGVTTQATMKIIEGIEVSKCPFFDVGITVKRERNV